MKHLATLIFLLLLSGCRSAPDSAVVAIILSTFSRLGTTCLSVSGHDPSPEVLASLRAAKRNVVPASQCMKDQYGPIDSRRARATLVSVKPLRRAIPWRLKVEYSRSGGLLDGDGAIMTLERVNGTWIVRSRASTWISISQSVSPVGPRPVRSGPADGQLVAIRPLTARVSRGQGVVADSPCWRK